jgi:hypothetical protein
MTSLVIVVLGSACGSLAGDSARCDDVRQQILAALQNNIESGVLLSTAIPCGPDGIANHPDYFDPRVDASNVQYLQGAFENACDELASSCGYDEDL